MSKQPSRTETTYCEMCSIVCLFDHDQNRWTSVEGRPMYTGKHCSEKCYNLCIKMLEYDVEHHSEKRKIAAMRLNAYKQIDIHRCKECGSCSYYCHCMEWCDTQKKYVFRGKQSTLPID